ncbi:MAG TPA: hypothetical protein VNM22_09300 [Candidatus Limnocylindrales bacterium]|nr:hypothetical protein [Candidatus Limnocylindrales bacterium]
MIFTIRPTAGLTFRVLPGSILDITTYSFVPPTTLSGFLRRLAMMHAGFDFPNTGPNDQDTPFYVLPRELIPLGAYPVGACSRPAHRTYRKGPRDLGHRAFSDMYRGKASGRENIQLHTWEYLLTDELTGYVVSENEKELARMTGIVGYGSKMGKEGYAFVERVSGPLPLQRTELKAVPSTLIPADDLFEKNPRVPADIFTLYSFVWLETEEDRTESQKKQRRGKSTSLPKIYSTSAFDEHPSPVVKYKPFPAARVDGQTGVMLDYLHYEEIFIPVSLIETLRGEIVYE